MLVSRAGLADGPEAQRPDWDFSIFKGTTFVDQLPYFKELLDQFKRAQGRVRILKFLPGCSIGEHRDMGSEAADMTFGQVRLHIPIITNDQVVLSVGGEKIRMLPGRLYYVNFTKRHFVRNDGETTRIHLVLDLKVNEWLRKCFPELSLPDRLENVIVRYTHPVFWKLRWWSTSRAFSSGALQRIQAPKNKARVSSKTSLNRQFILYQTPVWTTNSRAVQ